MTQPKKLFLLDAMALIYRAYFAFSRNPRMTSYGMNTSAIFGFANSLYDVLKNERPTHIAVAFDSFAPTLRHAEFEEYKAHREKMPEDIARSLPYIRRLLQGFRIPILEKEGYEADDIIGTLAKKAEDRGFVTYMMTPDKDFGQLVSERTLIYRPGRMGNSAEIIGIGEIKDKYDIDHPSQVIDILGLWGDVSDNIPGVPGIGEAIAKKLISQYGSLENVLEHAGDLKGKIRENLQAFREQALQSKQLATIILDAPVELNEEELVITEPDLEGLKELFEEIEFRTFAQRIFTDYSVERPGQYLQQEISQPDLFTSAGQEISAEIPADSLKTIRTVKHAYHLTDTPEKRRDLIGILKEQGFFCFDTETTGLDANNSQLVGLSFAVRPWEAWYVPLPPVWEDAFAILQEFKSLLEDTAIEKIGQNMKFDIAILKWYGVEVKGNMFDTMLAHYLLQPDMRHNMDLLAETYLNYSPVPIEDLIGKKGKNQLSMIDVETNAVKEYAAEDADITLQLKMVFEPLLRETGTRQLFDEVEMPLVPVLASMEAEGVKVDIRILKEYSGQLDLEVRELEKIIYEQAGVTFNISSPKQLGEVLFEKLRIIDNPKLTQTKQYSTGEDVLLKLVNKHPIIQTILDYRSLTKLKSTYVDTLPGLVNPRTGRIHTSYNQAVAATGRLSSNNPNMQNIPIRTERGREIRKAFVPSNQEYILLSADYSQIELRIIAEMSGDEGMIQAFRMGQDIHTATAAKVYGVDTELVSREMRRNAKTVNFGIIYGISAFGLAERLGIPRKEAASIIDQYFLQYPGIRDYMDKTIAFARENGYVETIMKRRRYIKDIASANAVVRGFAERNAINAPIQGSAADMIKVAMIHIFNEMQAMKLKSRMILQVHDELVFDVHRSEVNLLRPVVEEKMKFALPMRVPIEVEMNTGENWLDAH
ncbi:MAG: DNA polymerase I [Bacteroidales bacterium]|nr:DNA polymerase I [Lentimicrobiaceae bacterium]MDD5695557.1 DNA polymerase I [Bacteroidales bacterium]